MDSILTDHLLNNLSRVEEEDKKGEGNWNRKRNRRRHSTNAARRANQPPTNITPLAPFNRPFDFKWVLLLLIRLGIGLKIDLFRDFVRWP